MSIKKSWFKKWKWSLLLLYLILFHYTYLFSIIVLFFDFLVWGIILINKICFVNMNIAYNVVTLYNQPIHVKRQFNKRGEKNNISLEVVFPSSLCILSKVYTLILCLYSGYLLLLLITRCFILLSDRFVVYSKR